MQRLRITFKRSRTPTGAEMKTQSSLEVPKQVRSASFDEMQLEVKRNQEMLQQSDDKSLLKVPVNNQRSKSVDAGSSEDCNNILYLEVPRPNVRRRSSSEKLPVFCVHCQYIDDIAKFHQSIAVEEESFDSNTSLESLSSLLGSNKRKAEVRKLTGYGKRKDSNETSMPTMPECNIKVTLSLNSPSSTSADTNSEDTFVTDVSATMKNQNCRRRSIISPKLSRQSAFVVVDKNCSLDNISNIPSEGSDSDLVKTVPNQGQDQCQTDSGNTIFDFSGINLKIDESFESSVSSPKLGGSDSNVPQVKDIFLQVPELKRDRAASVDSCFTKVSQSGKAEEVSSNSLEPPSNVSLRSRSVDIVLPTDEQSRYKALAMAHSTRVSMQG
ncbi:hypothetical protein Phum_PHUM178420 [Pediculus humanus corporis]|uniref:Eye-specific diacylglycerol kinase n=1 Tax=Pediculus humanus subsp. corporis TaxID=121224 RepID=E0VGC4_PEDHC|nr:uncharacterized protein Phum_PHUM178420 [Pediculus humanus corporis]EEB12430.1 hypothetical protein Phum_PHUM178420 [Pediculus humanus corporis]